MIGHRLEGLFRSSVCVWIDDYFSQSNHQCTVKSCETVVGAVINPHCRHDSCHGSIHTFVMTPARALLTSQSIAPAQGHDGWASRAT